MAESKVAISKTILVTITASPLEFRLQPEIFPLRRIGEKNNGNVLDML